MKFSLGRRNATVVGGRAGRADASVAEGATRRNDERAIGRGVEGKGRRRAPDIRENWAGFAGPGGVYQKGCARAC